MSKETRDKRVPMIASRKASLPIVYGDTPSFLGVPAIKASKIRPQYDVIFAGVPWEGSVTWGSYSGCELAPRAIRHASARYGGFLPERGIDIFDHLEIGDMGDIAVFPGDPQATMKNVHRMASEIYAAGSIPFVLGGDHSFTPEIVRALSEHSNGKIGIIHFDAHFDNASEFGDDRVPRCGPIYGLSRLPGVRNESIVHIGIRGPRNSRSQFDFAEKIGATVFYANMIREAGIKKVLEDAIAIAKHRTERVYVTICSDCVDVAYNAGGPIDFNGLYPHELFNALCRLGEEGIAGLDYVEVYPPSDPRSISSHLAAWALIHALSGMAAKKKRDPGPKRRG
jgi:agmatinase